MFLKYYECPLRKVKQFIYVLSLLSNLALDPSLMKGSKNSKIRLYIGYTLLTIGKTVFLRPLLLISSGRRIHKKMMAYLYIGVRSYSLGGFIVGRISSREMEEASEETSMVPHFDLRNRRLVIGENDLGVIGRLNYWFVPIAVFSGLHRWGFSWRRIVLSTIPLYIDIGKCPSMNDLELLSASIVEYVYNRMMYRIYGEERYMTPEAIWYLKQLNNYVKAFIEKYGISDLEKIKDFLNGLCNRVLYDIDSDIESLREIYDKLRSGGSIPRDYRFYLLDVYAVNLKTLNNIINRMFSRKSIDNLRRHGFKNIYFIFVATETMSPIYLSFLADKIEKLYDNSLSISSNINEFRIVLLYTPHVLPQVLYSLYILSDLRRIDYNDLVYKHAGNDRVIKINPKNSSNSSNNPKQGKPKLTIELIPVVDKQPSIVYTELKALLETYKNKEKSLVVFAPQFTGTASILAALKKLSIEYKDDQKVRVKEFLVTG